MTHDERRAGGHVVRGGRAGGDGVHLVGGAEQADRRGFDGPTWFCHIDSGSYTRCDFDDDAAGGGGGGAAPGGAGAPGQSGAERPGGAGTGGDAAADTEQPTHGRFLRGATVQHLYVNEGTGWFQYHYYRAAAHYREASEDA